MVNYRVMVPDSEHAITVIGLIVKHNVVGFIFVLHVENAC